MKIKFLHKILLYILFLISWNIPLLANECDSCYCCEPFCNNGFTAGAEWLYWKVKEDHLRAGTFVDDFPDPTLKIANATIIQPHSKFNSGIRGHLGYRDSCSCWELEAIYTYIPLDAKSAFRETIPLDEQTETHRQFIIPNNNDFPSFQGFSSNSGLTAFTSLLTDWNGKLSYLDIDISRQLTFNCFSLRPHIGVRAAWMTQHLHMEGGLVFVSTNDSTFGSLRYKERYKGYGIEGGLWIDWQLGCGFSFDGHFGGSLLYSKFKINILSESSIEENGPVVFIINSGAKDITAIPTIDYLVALKYETQLDQFCFSAHVGWEQRIFFNMNQMVTTSGNLSLQGLILGGRVAF